MDTPRQIVICCDGTGNQFTTHPTNVIRLWRSLERGARQTAYYDPGVGTLLDSRAFTRLRKWLHRNLDGAIGASVRDNALEAYSFLMAHWEPGAELYLFGFSRGAYTVRALAGLINWFGILEPRHANIVPYLWLLYSDEDGEIATRKDRQQVAERIKQDFARPAGVHFLGAWDTVSSVGWMWRPQSLPGTASAPGVTIIRHAVAVDERRRSFVQNLFTPDAGRDCVQMLFAGAHADVGGGYPPPQSGLAAVTLKWMTDEAGRAGLRLDPVRLSEQFAPEANGVAEDANAPMHNELRHLGWKIVEALPRSRTGWLILLLLLAPTASLVFLIPDGTWRWRPWLYGLMALLLVAVIRIATHSAGKARNFRGLARLRKDGTAPRLEEHASIRERRGYAPSNLPSRQP